MTALKRPDCCAPTTGTGSGLSAGDKAKSALLDGWPERFTFCLTGDAETNRLKSEANRRFRLHRLAETYITMGNAGVLLYPDEKPKVFAQTGFGGEAVTYPVFYSSREVKELGLMPPRSEAPASQGAAGPHRHLCDLQ